MERLAKLGYSESTTAQLRPTQLIARSVKSELMSLMIHFNLYTLTACQAEVSKAVKKVSNICGIQSESFRVQR